MACAMMLQIAPARAALHGEVIEFGETTAERANPAPPTQDDHTLIPTSRLAGIRFVAHTGALPARLCLRFGVRVRLTPDGDEPLPRQVTVVVTHPRITRPDQVSSTEDSFPAPLLGDTVYAGWTFDQPWEAQPGPWTFAFRFEGQVVASQAFTITAPGPDRSLCGAMVS
jgi:hypothetical protein